MTLHECLGVLLLCITVSMSTEVEVMVDPGRVTFPTPMWYPELRTPP